MTRRENHTWRFAKADRLVAYAVLLARVVVSGRGGAGVDGGRDEGGDGDEREDADRGDGPEGRAPAVRLAEEGSEGDAEHVGGGQAGEHQGDGARGAILAHEAGRDDRADAEERSVAEGRDDTPGHHHGIRRADRGEEVADDEEHHEAEEHVLAGQASRGKGEADAADGDAQRVAGDEPPGSGLGDLEVSRDLGEEPCDDELGEADAEAADGKGEQAEGKAAAGRSRRRRVVPWCQRRGHCVPSMVRYSACATTGCTLVARAGYCKTAL